MKKQVILTIVSGSIEQGFSVILRLIDNDEVKSTSQTFGQLPPSASLFKVFKLWQTTYQKTVQLNARVKLKTVGITHASCDKLSYEFLLEFNRWLNSGHKEWQKLREKLQQNLTKNDDFVLVIESNDIQIRQLPWHLWDLLSQHFVNCEVVLSLPEYSSIKTRKTADTNELKVLAILGDSTGIDIQKDRELLETLPHAAVTFLVEPQRQQLNEQLWNPQGWDILFFAGHSASQNHGNNGRVSINRSDSLTINDLEYALKTAIGHGLKLAIFNSCDGLGIAGDLAGLNISQMIVMREPVPDKVAQEFLKNFLQAFSSGKSLYLSVREAREKLQGLEGEFPCASWLPVIFQASSHVPLTLSQLRRGSTRRGVFNKRNLAKLLLASSLATSILIGIRYFGLIEPMELKAFDSLVRLRPKELPDRRLLLVTVEEEDLNRLDQNDRKGSLSDRALEKLLQKLDKFQPRVIGLDIYRDYPVNPKYQSLATRMRQSDRFIAVCKASDSEVDPKGVAPPPEVSLERLGFSDFATDIDGIVRRQLVLATPEPTSACATPYSFSTMLALYYLAAQNILVDSSQSEIFKIGNTAFPRLTTHASGYQNLEYGGYQILLNYRSLRSPELIAERVTLTQVLDDRVNPKYIKDRIILIGTTANSFPDFWSTPYNSSPNDELLGVFLQAQMVSQILAAVLDHRPLFSVWPYWQEIIWIFAWSLFGGIIACQFKSGSYWILALVGGKLCLFVVSFALLIHNGYWVPLVPSVIALAASSIIVRVF